MSIDFDVNVSRTFDLLSLRDEVIANVEVLTGTHTSADVLIWPKASSARPRKGTERKLAALGIGPTASAVWITISVAAGEASVDIGSTPMWLREATDETLHVTILVRRRTAASVVLAAASLVAVAKLGEGTIEPGSRALASTELAPDALLAALRYQGPAAPIRVASEAILRQTPGFASWIREESP